MLTATLMGISATTTQAAENDWLKFQLRDLAGVTIAGVDVASETLALEDLPGRLARAQPVKGLQTCQVDAPAPQPAVGTALELHLKNGRVLRFRTDSTCRYGLPWNVTDGRYLAAIYDEETGAILDQMLRQRCTDCPLPAGARLPEPSPVRYRQVAFGDLLTALQSEWRRNPHAPMLPGAQLQSALIWMDRARFEQALDAIAHQPLQREQVRRIAAEVLQYLQTQVWHCADDLGGGDITIEKPRDASYAILLPGMDDLKYAGRVADDGRIAFTVPTVPVASALDFDPEHGRLSNRARPGQDAIECRMVVPQQ
jgi:hypothetical protein